MSVWIAWRRQAALGCMALVCGVAPALVLAHTPVSAPASAATQAAASVPRPGLNAHTREDIARHQAMAKAHAQAAQCLESGQSATACQQQLQTGCKGLALGKNCGMRHSH